MTNISDSSEFFIMISFAILTIVFSIPVIIIIIIKKFYQNYAFRILLYIAINDILKSILSFFPPLLIKDSPICTLIATATYFILLSNISWACCINATIFQIIVLESPNFERYQNFWLVFSYLIPAVFSFLPLITSSYGYSEGFCELKLNKMGNIWRFSIFYIPVTMNLIITLLLFIKVYRKVKNFEMEEIKNVIFVRGFIYSIIISSVIVPFEAVRILQLFIDSKALETAALIGYCISLLHGFANSVVFFFNKTVRSALSKNQNNEDELKDITDGNSSLMISFRSA